jgi:hypothetical protein
MFTMKLPACAVSLSALVTFAAITFAGPALRSEGAPPIAQGGSTINEFDFLVGLHAGALKGRRAAVPLFALWPSVKKNLAPCRGNPRISFPAPGSVSCA